MLLAVCEQKAVALEKKKLPTLAFVSVGWEDGSRLRLLVPNLLSQSLIHTNSIRGIERAGRRVIP